MELYFGIIDVVNLLKRFKGFVWEQVVSDLLYPSCLYKYSDLERLSKETRPTYARGVDLVLLLLLLWLFSKYIS